MLGEAPSPADSITCTPAAAGERTPKPDNKNDLDARQLGPPEFQIDVLVPKPPPSMTTLVRTRQPLQDLSMSNQSERRYSKRLAGKDIPIYCQRWSPFPALLSGHLVSFMPALLVLTISHSGSRLRRARWRLPFHARGKKTEDVGRTRTCTCACACEEGRGTWATERWQETLIITSGARGSPGRDHDDIEENDPTEV